MEKLAQLELMAQGRKKTHLEKPEHIVIEKLAQLEFLAQEK
jgi:hypothetical protein